MYPLVYYFIEKTALNAPDSIPENACDSTLHLAPPDPLAATVGSQLPEPPKRVGI
ncbi:hypothetical protein FBY50_1099 [Zymomonas mobilis]|nr:hypothetical protein FBY50_1099 [Zymomonas mobilis]